MTAVENCYKENEVKANHMSSEKQMRATAIWAAVEVPDVV